MFKIRVFIAVVIAISALIFLGIENYSAQAEERIRYSIWNKTNYNIELLFLPTENTDMLPPGVKKPCNSPIRNSKYPKVKAFAPNGATWLRTISKHGCEYKIVDRTTDDGSPGIQIIP